jgi:endo-1,4-beta-xylanase
MPITPHLEPSSGLAHVSTSGATDARRTLRSPSLITGLRRRLATTLGVVAAALACGAGTAQAQLVSHSFEDGTLQGWFARGHTLVNTTEAARTGEHSLKVTGRTAGWNGPGLDLRGVLQPNTEYQISAWVRTVSGQPDAPINFTMENVPGANQWQWVGSTTATSTAWSQIQGSFTTGAATYTTLQLYAESSNTTLEFYLDDVTITGPDAPPPPPPARCPEPLDQSGYNTGFETGLEGWSPRGGDVVLTRTTAQAASGDYSLFVSGRTAFWNGATINVQCKLHVGHKYFVGVKVRLADGEDPVNVRVSLQRTLNGVTTFPTLIGNTQVTSSGWVDLSREVVFDMDSEQLQLYVETASGTASFYIDDFLLVHMPILPIQQDIPSVYEVLDDYFPVGAAITPSQTSGRYGQLLDKHFNLVVAENAQKWDAIQPTEGNFNWTQADIIADYARDRGIKMRYHTLLWHAQVPAWVFQDTNGNPLVAGNAAHRELLIERMKTHIQEIVKRYDDVVESWDVVNEVIADGGGLRNSPWLQIIGPEYIDYAFLFAAEVVTDGALLINDYNTNLEPKRTTLRNVVQGLLDRGIPIDGVGHQMHINIDWPSLSNIRETLEMFAAMGLMNEITEMDMSVYTNSTDTSPVTEAQLARQGYRYRDIFNLYRELSPIINSVTLWGLSDDVSWLKGFPIARDDKPLLFDEQQQAKYAYWGIVDPGMLPIVPKTHGITQGSVRIAGNDDAVWGSMAAQPLLSNAGGSSWANFRALWQGDRLFVRVLVSDTTPIGEGDVVDIYVGNQKFSFAGEGRLRPNGSDAMLTAVDGGYRLLASLPAGSLATGGTLKFDVRVKDGATGSVLSWSDTQHRQDTNLNNLGTLNLQPARKVAEVTRGTPIVDAIEDAVWRKATTIVTDRFQLATQGATATVKLLWDAEYLYVYATLKDPVLNQTNPNVWEQDSVEIFVDPNHAQTTTYESDDGQYRVNYLGERSFGGAATSARFTTATRQITGGYVVEAAIRIDAVPLTLGQFIGFDFQVNDANASGVRTSVATWNDLSGQAYQNTAHFGALKLVK